MSDIARMAGVSRPTVSAVLNDREAIGIAQETRERVLDTAKQLGYRRNALARAVKTGRSFTIGFFAGDADLEYSSSAFSGVLDEAEESHYTVKRFRLYDRVSDAQIIERCSEQRVDGVIVNDTGSALTVELIRREFERQSVPVVWLDPKGPQSWGVQVRPDDEHGTIVAVRHLAELGHRHIAFIGGIQNVGTSVLRLSGYERGMQEARLEAGPVRWTAWRGDRVIAAVEELLSLPSPPTAFICGSDAMALLILRCLRGLGMRLPQDISVVGFGNLARVDLADPSLTTIHVPYVEMGREAVKQLLHMMGKPTLSLQHKQTLFPTRLILRDSTAPPPE